MKEKMSAAPPLLAQQYALIDITHSSTMMFGVAGTSQDPITISDGVESDELLNKNYCPTPQGWILVRDIRDANNTYLLDHRNHRRVQLPPLEGIAPDILVGCHTRLSNKDPTNPGCIVLVVEPDETIMWYYRTGHYNGDDDSWIKYEYDIGTQGNEEYGFEKTPICSIAAYGGKFYFNLDLETKMGVIEFLPTPVFNTISIHIPQYFSPKEDTIMDFLVESGDDELYLVTLLYEFDEKEVDVYKMDFSTYRWLPVDDLGGNAFFLSANFAASCNASEEHGIQKNCVYSLINHMADKSLKMFAIEEGGWGTAELRKLHETYLFRPRNIIDIEEAINAGQHANRRMLWILPTCGDEC